MPEEAAEKFWLTGFEQPQRLKSRGDLGGFSTAEAAPFPVKVKINAKVRGVGQSLPKGVSYLYDRYEAFILHYWRNSRFLTGPSAQVGMTSL